MEELQCGDGVSLRGGGGGGEGGCGVVLGADLFVVSVVQRRVSAIQSGSDCVAFRVCSSQSEREPFERSHSSGGREETASNQGADSECATANQNANLNARD